MVATRMTSGIFVWSIEQGLLALIAFGIVTAWQSLATSIVATADFWLTFVFLISCFSTLLLQTAIAFRATSDTVSLVSEDHDGDLSYLHKPVAQAHCCVVVLLSTAYGFMFVSSLYDLNWASAWYPAAPGLLFATGSGTIAFCCIFFVVSVANAWSCTSVGDSNYLFLYQPLFLLLCVIYPLIHEIGQNGLIICSSSLVSTLTFVYLNLTIASSFALHFMDIFEFDPAHVFPVFMHSMAGNRPLFRVYSLLHGLLIIIPFITYAAFTPSISVGVVVFLSILALAATVLQSLDITALLMLFGQLNLGQKNGSNTSESAETPTSQDNPKERNVKLVSWLHERRKPTASLLQNETEDNQLRINFMRLPKQERNVMRKRG
jgi:hypothetical protein